jgi:3-oxoadipate CoA-transferase beta subunit
MDLAAGARAVWIGMEHCTKKGDAKIVQNCTYPLTATRCVKMIFTDIAVIRVTEEGLFLIETAPGWNLEAVQQITEAKLLPDNSLRVMDLNDAPAGRR